MAEIAAQRGDYRTAAEEYLVAAERSDDAEVSQRAAQFAFDYGFDTWALRAARRWASLEPANTSAHLVLARLYLGRNDVEAAWREAGLALGPAEDRAEEDYLLLIGELSQEDNAAGLTRIMTRLAAVTPPSPDLSLALGMVAIDSREFELARRAARDAMQGERAVQAKQLLIRVLMAEGREQQALEEVDRYLQDEPSLLLELERVRILAAADRHDEALSALADLDAAHKGDPDVTRLSALIHMDAGEVEKAWEGFSALLNAGQHTDESFYYMAQLAERNSQFDQALRLYGRVQDGPFLVPAQIAVMRLAEDNGDLASALARLDDFASDYPAYAADALQLRAGVLERAGRTEEALDALDEALERRSEDVALLLARGALLDRTGRLEDALADMRAAVAAAPDSALPLNALGYTLADRTRHFDEAYRLVRRAIELDPGNAAILDSLGWVYYRQRKLPEARTYLALAYSQFPDPEVAAHLGEVMWQQGDRDAARSLWNEALERNPDSRTLQAVMARLMQK
jgi:tetratricopeptide (TPR) repeat protein